MKRRTLSTAATALALLAALALASPAAAQQTAPKPDQWETSLVQIVFLIADREGSSSLDDLPENLRPAVEDIRGFLPFKQYKMLDSGVMRTDRHAILLIDGPKDVDYEVEVRLGPSDGPRRNIQGLRVVEKHDSGKALRQLMESSFSAEIGETVVVGTSKLNGSGQALIALLTLLP